MRSNTKPNWSESDYFDHRYRNYISSANKAGVKRTAKRSFNRRDRRNVKRELRESE